MYYSLLYKPGWVVKNVIQETHVSDWQERSSDLRLSITNVDT